MVNLQKEIGNKIKIYRKKKIEENLVNRKGKKEVNDYNCYVFTEINKNLLKENKESKKGGYISINFTH